ncbi:hypothetical protein D3C71_1725400 [compost metagenome]
MFADVGFTGCRGHCVAFHCLVESFGFISGTPDGLHVFFGLGIQPLTRERQIADGNAQIVILFHLLVQLVAIAAGDIGKHGDHVLLLRRFINDHLIFQRFQFAGQQLIGDVDRLFATDVVQRALQNVFAVFAHVQNAVIGQHGFQAAHR